MALELTTRQRIGFTFAPVKIDGSPAEVEEGSVTVASSDETVATVLLVAGTNTGHINAVVEGGPCRCIIEGDADRGQGVVKVTTVMDDVTVVTDSRDQANTFVVTFGEPEDKP